MIFQLARALYSPNCSSTLNCEQRDALRHFGTLLAQLHGSMMVVAQRFARDDNTKTRAPFVDVLREHPIRPFLALSTVLIEQCYDNNTANWKYDAPKLLENAVCLTAHDSAQTVSQSLPDILTTLNAAAMSAVDPPPEQADRSFVNSIQMSLRSPDRDYVAHRPVRRNAARIEYSADNIQKIRSLFGRRLLTTGISGSACLTIKRTCGRLVATGRRMPKSSKNSPRSSRALLIHRLQIARSTQRRCSSFLPTISIEEIMSTFLSSSLTMSRTSPFRTPSESPRCSRPAIQILVR
jgi:hypothetical protein